MTRQEVADDFDRKADQFEKSLSRYLAQTSTPKGTEHARALIEGYRAAAAHLRRETDYHLSLDGGTDDHGNYLCPRIWIRRTTVQGLFDGYEVKETEDRCTGILKRMKRDAGGNDYKCNTCGLKESGMWLRGD